MGLFLGEPHIVTHSPHILLVTSYLSSLSTWATWHFHLPTPLRLSGDSPNTGLSPHGTRVPSRHGPKFATWNGATERLVHCDGCVLLIYSMWMYVIVTPCYSQVVDIDDIAMQGWTCQRIENKWQKNNTAIETMYIINPIPLILNRIEYGPPNCTNPTPNHCFWRVWNIWGNGLIRIYPLAYACNNTPAMWGERDEMVFGAIPVQCQSCALWVELEICPQSQTWGQKSNND